MSEFDKAWYDAKSGNMTAFDVRKAKYGKLPKPGDPISQRSNVAYIASQGDMFAFETDDDEETAKVLDIVCKHLCILKRKRPDLTWNAGEGHFRTRWTRFQMVGALK